MTERAPRQEWWSASEIAEAALPDLPPTRQGVEKLIKRQGWRESGQARKRDGRGGGWEYHWSLFPVRARRTILPPLEADGKGAARAGRDEAWAWFEALPAPVQDKARARLDAIQRVEALVGHGDAKQRAVHLIGNALGIPGRTIWGWFALIDGVRPDDRLPYLAPRHRAAPARAAQVHCDPDWWDTLKSDYLRPAKRSFAVCYRAACKLAEAKGWVTLPFVALAQAVIEVNVDFFAHRLLPAARAAEQAILTRVTGLPVPDGAPSSPGFANAGTG